VQSLLEIARKMDISPDMIFQMARELTNKGYLQEIGMDCAEPQKGSPDCRVNST
jgi:Mn-dependent DtxR family transcriptional regulator